jgi:hypothetical protein
LITGTGTAVGATVGEVGAVLGAAVCVGVGVGARVGARVGDREGGGVLQTKFVQTLLSQSLLTKHLFPGMQKVQLPPQFTSVSSPSRTLLKQCTPGVGARVGVRVGDRVGGAGVGIGVTKVHWCPI